MVHDIHQGVAPAAAHEVEEKNLAKATAGIDSLIAQEPFQAEWDSLHKHRDPEWFRDKPDLIYFDFEFQEVITPEHEQKRFATVYDWAARNKREAPSERSCS